MLYNKIKQLASICGILAITMPALTSCSEENDMLAINSSNSNDAVKFTARMEGAARSTATAFEPGDAIGIFAVLPDGNGGAATIANSGNFADNVKHIYDGSVFMAAEGSGIIKEEGKSLSYTAVYPYIDGIGAAFDFSINSDQSTHEGYMLSDLCTVSTSPIVEKDVNLSFYHRLSHLVLNIGGFNIAGEMSLKLINVATAVHVDLNANTFEAVEGSIGEIKVNHEATNTYRAIVVPQLISEGTTILSITLNGREFKIKTPSDIDLRSGREYSLSVQLINGSIVLTKGDIANWDTHTQEEEFSDEFFSVEDADFHNSELIEGTDDSDPLEISANQGALAGGMNFINIKSIKEYKTFELSVKNRKGYWSVVPDVQTSSAGYFNYVIHIAYGIYFNDDMSMRIVGVQENGNRSVGYDVDFNYVESKSGDLNINLTFSKPKDVDLHLYTPSGEHIYYGQRGGSVSIDGETISYGLDHDSNPGCNLDYLNNENIYIPAQLVENGTYTVVVDMYSNCSTSYDCEWSVVARYKDKIVPNELSAYTNPASGVYPASCGNGDHTQVIKFTITDANTSGRMSIPSLKKMPGFKNRALTDDEQWKVEIENL